MAESLKLKTNVPETIALQFAEGLPTSSQFGGDQVMFTLTDGRKLYVAPIVAKKISDAGIGARQVFSICKRESAEGNRRVVRYEIETASCVQHEAVSNANAASNSKLTSTPPSYSFAGNAARAIHAVAAPAQVMAGPAAGAASPAFVPAPAPQDSAAVEFMKLAGRGAIDAVVSTEEYARARGLSEFVFDSLSVQKIMVSLYIDLRKGGRA